MLFNIFRFCVYIFSLQQFFKIWFPNFYYQSYNFFRIKSEKTSIILIYYFIYFFSKLQLLFRKGKNSVNSFIIYYNLDFSYLKELIKEYIIYDDNLFNIEKYNYISFIKDGNILSSIIINNNDYNNDNNKLIVEKSPPQYDYLIYHNFENIINNLLYHSVPGNFGYEITKYKFIQIEVILLDNRFKIELCNNHYNFYMVNNWIDDLFIIHFLKFYYKMDNYTNEYLLNYRLSIIDQDVNILSLDNTDKIYFELENYIIKKKNQNICILEEAKNRKITDFMSFNNNLDEVLYDEIIENEYIEIEK